jgi:hypothetical protein
MLRVLGAFQNWGVEYVLVGAAAMGVHGVIRATEDLGTLWASYKATGEREGAQRVLDHLATAGADRVATAVAEAQLSGTRQQLSESESSTPNITGITALIGRTTIPTNLGEGTFEEFPPPMIV